MAQGSHENEIKLAVPDVRSAKRLLRRGGFKIAHRRVFERNVVLDTRKLTLRHQGELLRVRRSGAITTVTFKGRPVDARHKSREEVELEVTDARAMETIFERLGFHPVFRYEKYRTEYRQDRGAGMAMLDETPVGIYLELEGSPRWVDRMAQHLGFTEKDYILRSYGRLYLDWCRKKKLKPSDMVFGASRRARS